MDQSRLRELLKARFNEEELADEVGDFLFRHATPLDAFMYADLFWPDFVELHGMVLWAGADWRSADRVGSVLEHYGGDRAATEKSLNYIDVMHLFGSPDPAGNIDDELWDDLEQLIAEMWKARLKLLYPARRFAFELVDDDNGGFLFWEDRDGS